LREREGVVMERLQIRTRIPTHTIAAALVLVTGTLAHAADWNESGIFSWLAVGPYGGEDRNARPGRARRFGWHFQFK
jgi:hypothetical protein